jgi:hypothetical protein
MIRQYLIPRFLRGRLQRRLADELDLFPLQSNMDLAALGVADDVVKEPNDPPIAGFGR